MNQHFLYLRLLNTHMPKQSAFVPSVSILKRFKSLSPWRQSIQKNSCSTFIPSSLIKIEPIKLLLASVSMTIFSLFPKMVTFDEVFTCARGSVNNTRLFTSNTVYPKWPLSSTINWTTVSKNEVWLRLYVLVPSKSENHLIY